MNRNVIVSIALIVSTAAFGAWQTLQKQELEAQLAAMQTSHDRWNQDNQQQADSYNKAIGELKMATLTGKVE